MPGDPPRHGTGLAIRVAMPDDAATIARISILGWRAAYREILDSAFLDGLSIEARTAGWRRLLARDPSGGCRAWLAVVDDRAIGFASTGPARDDDLAAGTAELYAIYVDPTAWRHGAGRALVEATVEHWRERGSPPLVLWVFEANARGRAFYEALGWRADGERRELAIGGRLPVEVRYRLEP